MIEGQAAGAKLSRLRYGMIGGGPGAFIGDVHRKAVAMDGRAELVCGAFSRTFGNTLATGEALGLAKERLYRTFDEMLRAEAARNELLPLMAACREHADKLETMVDDDRWPLPKYNELLWQ